MLQYKVNCNKWQGPALGVTPNMSSKLNSQRKIFITYITYRVVVSCHLKFTPGTNSGSHTLQFGSGGHILYCSRIRKNVTENREQTEKAITEVTLIVNRLLS